MPPPDETIIHSVVQMSLQGMKRRAIARALHISRNTVREILADHHEARAVQHSALPRPRTRNPRSKLDPFRPKIDVLLHKYDNITAQRIFEILRDNGYDGGETIVKDLVRRIRPKPSPKPSLETPPCEPGDMAECDWSPYQVAFTHAPPMKLQVFGYTLRYSTRKYYSFHEGNGLHPLMDGHVHAFERFGGAARRCKYDSQKPVVLRWEGPQPIYNLRFIEFATYYEFSPVACRRRHPNDKPRVERSFYELSLSFFRGREFRDLEDLKAQLAHWMDTIADVRPIKRMRRRTRLELFAEEKPLLRVLPSHPYDTARVLYALCDIEGFIPWQGNWYSLPYEYVTDILPVRVTENELFIYKTDLTCIARHQLLPRGAQEKSILPGHRPHNAHRGPELDQLRGVFEELGEPASAFLAALEKRQRLSAGYHARKILALREGYDTADLVKALSHALAYGAFEHGSIERILIARASRRRLDQYVAQATAEKHQNEANYSGTEPRDLTEYDALPCIGSKNQHQGEPGCPSNRSEDRKDLPQRQGNESKSTCNDSD